MYNLGVARCSQHEDTLLTVTMFQYQAPAYPAHSYVLIIHCIGT